jgi:hypothetical protein
LDADGLARAVSALLGDLRLRTARATAGIRVAVAGSEILEAVLIRLAPWLDRLAPQESCAAQPRLRA